MSRSAVGMHVVKLAMPMRAACGHKQGATVRIQAPLGQARPPVLRFVTGVTWAPDPYVFNGKSTSGATNGQASSAIATEGISG